MGFPSGNLETERLGDLEEARGAPVLLGVDYDGYVSLLLRAWNLALTTWILKTIVLPRFLVTLRGDEG